MYNPELNQPGPSRYQSYDYSFYSDHFTRNLNSDRLRGSYRGARQGYNTNNIQHNSNVNYPQQQWHPQNMIPPINPQHQQRDKKVGNNTHNHQNRKNKTNAFNAQSNTKQKNEMIIKTEDINYKIYKCPNCSLQFDCINRNNFFVGKVPLILNCKHTVCQECIPNMAKDNTVLCPICKNPSVLPTRYSPENLQDVFSPNFFLIGYIMWCKTQVVNPHFMSLVPVQTTGSISSTATDQQQTGVPCCFLSCNKKATVRCQDCNDVYCAVCCNTVHKSVKSLLSHKQIPLEETDKKPTLQLEFCSEHELDVDFYCTICNTDVCCYCFIEKHEGHTKENLSKLSEVEMEEFELNKENVKKMLKHLLITQKKLQDMRTCNTEIIQKKISNFFVNLHAKLQCIEKHLKKEISNYEKEGVQLPNVNDLNSIVESYVRELKTICAACEAAKVKKMNLKQIAINLKKVKNIPCYLISENVKELEPLKFDVQPDIENLEEMFTLKKNENGIFKLVSEEDLPSDYEKDVTDSYYETDLDSCISALNKTVLSEEFKTKKQAPKTGRHASFEYEMVEVTHIESLECFYVQLKKMQYQFAQMNSDINNYIKFGAPTVEHPQLNELYLVLYQSRNDKIWCRGRITEIKNGEMEPMYEVFFIDYGSSQTVDVSKIRQIVPDISSKKTFAIQCTLYNPSVSSWNKNAHVYMAKMINGKQVSMLVKNVNSGVHVVDLMVMSSSRGHTSIIDILNQMCSYAASDSDSVSSQKTSYNRGYKVFANSVEFRKFQEEKIIIVNVLDPHHIFVHIASHSESLKKMNNYLRQTFKNSRRNDCIPIEGTHVIVDYKDALRGNWHRGLVNKTDITTQKCHVLLVDWGLNVTVDWSNVRMMQEDFTRLESQALLVKLAHIEPIDKGTAWVDAATIFLQKYVRSQEMMKMIVHEIEPLEIALFEIVGDVDICINTQLVLEKFAVSTGKISQTLEWPRTDAISKPFLEDDGLLDVLLKNIDKSINDSDDEEDINVVKQKIEVIKFVDPSLIYIKFCKNEQAEINLNKELQIHYSKERRTKDSWDVGEFCIVLYNFSYVRGKILEKINKNKYKVNIYDRAAEVEVSLDKIFEFDKYFNKFPNVAFKAHLANIRPAGGDKWSLSSIDALERLFEKYKEIFGTRVEGDTTGKSIPMKMWYAHVKIGSALEAPKTKFISFNHLLVKIGFAYKLQNTESKKRSSEPEGSSLLHAIEKIASKDSSFDASLNQDSIEENTKTEYLSASKIEKQQKVLDTSEKSSKSLTDWNELVEEEEKMKTQKNDLEEAEIDEWIQPFPIKETEFYAWVTCAETGGILYLREEKLQNVYKEMEQNIKEYFDKETLSQHDDDWQPGQLCTIHYDDFFYRGKVYEVNSPDDIRVVMIDFGSDHKVSSKNLIRKILYPKIPAFGSKIKLHKIYPKSGAWLDSDYQTLLDVVSEYSKIIIMDTSDDGIPLAEVFTDKGVNVNQYLVKTCPNLRRSKPKLVDTSDNDSVIIEEEETGIEEEEEAIIEDEQVIVDEDTDLIEPVIITDTTEYTYKIAPLSNDDSDKKIAVSIMSVLEYNKIALKQTAMITDEFFELGEKIQKSIKFQPVIEKLEIGMPCVCQFSEDMIWYRAQIYNMDGIDCGYVFVFYVDFGNVESVSVTDIKMMRPEWFDLPVSCHIANINIELVSEKNIQHVTQFMKKLYGKNKLADIISKEPLCVDLFDIDGEIYYKSLLDKGLIKIK